MHYGIIPKTLQASKQEKSNASRAIRNRVYKNIITRGTCVVCGSDDAIAHHYDYSKKLDIFWLCSKHHLGLHRAERNNGWASYEMV